MALTGFNVSGVCYPDVPSAQQAIAGFFPQMSGNQPLISVYLTSVFVAPNTFNVSITSHDVTVVTPTGGQWTSTHPLTFAQCDPAAMDFQNVVSFNDGMQMGWGVVAAMAGAMAVIFIKKAFFR